MKHEEVRQLVREWMEERGYESLLPLRYNRYGMVRGSRGGWEKDPVLEILPKEWWYRRGEGTNKARKNPKETRPDDVLHYVGKGHLAFPVFGEIVILEYKPYPTSRGDLFRGIGQCLFYHRRTGLPAYLVVNEEDYKEVLWGIIHFTPLGAITYHKDPVVKWVEVVRYWVR